MDWASFQPLNTEPPKVAKVGSKKQASSLAFADAQADEGEAFID